MDPDACLSMILENIADEDWEQAATNAEALRDWLANSGSSPGGGKLRKTSIADFLMWVIKHPRLED
jgi:hypothetical protein